MLTNPPGSAQRSAYGSCWRWIKSTLSAPSSSPNTTQSTVTAGRGYSYSWLNSPALAIDMGSQLRQLAPITARQDGEPAPGLGVEVLVVEMERRRVALALPLVAAPQGEEPLDVGVELGRGVVG